jgi:hypothetical protein
MRAICPGWGIVGYRRKEFARITLVGTRGMYRVMGIGLESLVQTGGYEMGLAAGAICCCIEESPRRCIFSRVSSVVESLHLVLAKFDL